MTEEFSEETFKSALNTAMTTTEFPSGPVVYVPETYVQEVGEDYRSLLNGAITRELSRRRKPRSSDRKRMSGQGRACQQCGKAMPVLDRNFRLCQACFRQQS